MKRLLIGLILTAAPSTAAAAELGLALDTQGLAQRDLEASPLAYQGLGVGLRLEGREAPGPWRFDEDLRVTFGGLHPGGGARTFSLRVEDPVAGEDEVIPVRDANRALGGSLGLEGRRALGAAEVGLRLEADALDSSAVALGHWAWASLDLGPCAAWSVDLSDTAGLRLRASLPVVAVVTRFPETLNPLLPDRTQVGAFFATGTRVASLGSHQRLALGAELTLAGPGRWTWVVGLRADWLHDATPDDLYRLRGGLVVGARFGELGAS
ncbi:MAG: hypothetical protein H6739_29040 [Alphaproteobacteria bacterium]|nr:hypothetical protein [Alphaproteobacteria bacterium]